MSFCKIDKVTPTREIQMNESDMKGKSIIKPLAKVDYMKITGQLDSKGKELEIDMKNESDNVVTSSFDKQSRDITKIQIDLGDKKSNIKSIKRKKDAKAKKSAID